MRLAVGLGFGQAGGPDEIEHKPAFLWDENG